jgi:hypothetical protein
MDDATQPHAGETRRNMALSHLATTVSLTDV